MGGTVHTASFFDEMAFYNRPMKLFFVQPIRTRTTAVSQKRMRFMGRSLQQAGAKKLLV